MQELINNIRIELGHISPKHFKLKKKYATKNEIADFEKQNQLQFPTDLVDFWLTSDFEISAATDIYHDLQCEIGPSFFMFDEFEHLVEYWKENSGRTLNTDFKNSNFSTFQNRDYNEKLIIEKVFDKNWFPIAIDSFDGSICIDLNTGVKGVYGQLLYIIYNQDKNNGPYYTSYKTFSEFLLFYLNQLKDRKIEIEEGIIYPLTHF